MSKSKNHRPIPPLHPPVILFCTPHGQKRTAAIERAAEEYLAECGADENQRYGRMMARIGDELRVLQALRVRGLLS